MATRKRKLLKVIILGDSGCVVQALPRSGDAGMHAAIPPHVVSTAAHVQAYCDGIVVPRAAAAAAVATESMFSGHKQRSVTVVQEQLWLQQHGVHARARTPPPATPSCYVLTCCHASKRHSSRQLQQHARAPAAQTLLRDCACTVWCAVQAVWGGASCSTRRVC
jgi:hypothetical protein